jgi:RNA polymerase-interacting CarD/CdnL/TRCF family regulator
MNAPHPYKIGSYLIDSNQIYTIFKISDNRLYYRPSDKTGQSTVTGSVPQSNVALAGFRTPLAKADIEQFFTALSKSRNINSPIDQKLYKDIIIANDPFKLIPLIQQLWYNQNQANSTTSNSLKETLSSIITHLSNEFSLSTGKKPGFFQAKIIACLSQKSKR